MDDPTRCVFVTNGQIEAQQVKAFLEGSGIPCALRGESLSKTHAFTLDGLGRVEVVVAEADAQRAVDLLASAEAGELRLGEDVEMEREGGTS